MITGVFPRLLRWLGAAICIGLASCAIETGSAVVTVQPYSIHHGPGSAVGAILYLPGHSPDEAYFDAHTIRTPNIFIDMSRSGWDVYSIKLPEAEDRDYDYFAGQELLRVSGNLKKEGYRKVVLAGQSTGAWILAELGAREGPEDALILFSPATYGHDQYRSSNSTALYPLLRAIKKPVIMTNFSHDVFVDDDQRGQNAARILAKTGVPYIMIDHPPGLSGHAAGTLWSFAYAFETCFRNFLSGNPSAGKNDCAQRDIDDHDSRWMTNEAQLIATGAKPLDQADLRAAFLARTFYYFDDEGDWSFHAINEKQSVVNFLPMVVGIPSNNSVVGWYPYEGNQACFQRLQHFRWCFRVYLTPDGYYHLATRTGAVYTILPSS